MEHSRGSSDVAVTAWPGPSCPAICSGAQVLPVLHRSHSVHTPRPSWSATSSRLAPLPGLMWLLELHTHNFIFYFLTTSVALPFLSLPFHSGVSVTLIPYSFISPEDATPSFFSWDTGRLEHLDTWWPLYPVLNLEWFIWWFLPPFTDETFLYASLPTV